jgi:hypothetical protein
MYNTNGTETKQNNECINNTHCLCNQSCSGKTISNAYTECVFAALFIQKAKLMRHTALSSVSSPTISKFSKLSHKCFDFQKTNLNMKCLFWFSVIFVRNISHYKNNSARCYHKLCASLHGKQPFFLTNFNIT